MILNRIVALSLFVFSTMAVFSTTAVADSIDLNLRNSSAQFQYSGSMGREALGKAELQIGALYSEEGNNRNTLGEFGIVVKDEVGSKAPGFSAGVGIKGLVAHTKGTNESAVAIGGMVRFSPLDLSRLGIVGRIYVAPNITTFGDADRYIETAIQAEYMVIPNAAAYLGYRQIKFNLNTGASNTSLDEGVFIGVRMAF